MKIEDYFTAKGIRNTNNQLFHNEVVLMKHKLATDILDYFFYISTNPFIFERELN